MAKKRKATKVAKGRKKKVQSFGVKASGLFQKSVEKLSSCNEKNKKKRVKPFATNDGAELLMKAVSIASTKPVLETWTVDANGNPVKKSKAQLLKFCLENEVPFVLRSEVCSKATNYRADNAVRARLISWQKSKLILGDITVIWAVDARMAQQSWLDNGVTDECEKVFIVRTK
jgi:hypothetical protein